MVFAVIEQKEPHAGRMAFAAIAQPNTFVERCALARRLRDEVEVPLPIYVDGMDDASRALFSDLPSPAFVIDRSGHIADKLPWADPEPLAKSLAAVLARDPAVPAVAAKPWPLEQREVMARRLLAAGKPELARAWLEDAATPLPTTPTPLPVRAGAAIARAFALRGAPEPARIAALEAAQRAVEAAWQDEPARRLAARIELAEAAAGTPLRVTLWRAALAEAELRAPEPTQKWLRARFSAPPR